MAFKLNINEMEVIKRRLSHGGDESKERKEPLLHLVTYKNSNVFSPQSLKLRIPEPDKALVNFC